MSEKYVLRIVRVDDFSTESLEAQANLMPCGRKESLRGDRVRLFGQQNRPSVHVESSAEAIPPGTLLRLAEWRCGRCVPALLVVMPRISEHIPYSTYRPDQRPLSIVVHFASEPRNMHVNNIG